MFTFPIPILPLSVFLVILVLVIVAQIALCTSKKVLSFVPFQAGSMGVLGVLIISALITDWS